MSLYKLKSLDSMLLFIAITVCSLAFAQSNGNAECRTWKIEGQDLFAAIPKFQDTTLNVALLLVQFSDWETNHLARGSVGWEAYNQPEAIVYNKYRYHHYWDMYFSSGTYVDDNPLSPDIHPDVDSHGDMSPELDFITYGSFRDYWWEVSHHNLTINPAVTHPDSDSTSIFYSGLVNRVRPDGTVIWVTLDSIKSFYFPPGFDSDEMQAIRDSALAKAHELYVDTTIVDSLRLDVDIYDSDTIDKVLVVFAGNQGYGVAGGDFACTYPEHRRLDSLTTSYLGDLHTGVHEFGHLLGYHDYHGGTGDLSNGVGQYCIMGRAKDFNDGLLPQHPSAWLKLRSGWLNYEIVEADTSQSMSFS